MPENQNPVFTDNQTILGDGTVENPLSAQSSTPFGGILVASVDGPVVISGDGSFQDVASLTVNVPAGSWGVLVKASFVITPDTGNTQILWKFIDETAPSAIGETGGETIQVADDTSFISREWMAFTKSAWNDGDSLALQAACEGAGAQFSAISIAVFLIPAGF